MQHSRALLNKWLENSVDDIIRSGIMFGEHPPEGIYFTVVLVFGDDYIDDDATALQSPPLTTFPEALVVGDQIRDQLLMEKFKGAKYEEVDAEENDGFHTIIVGDNGDIIVKMAIEAHDYRGETLH